MPLSKAHARKMANDFAANLLENFIDCETVTLAPELKEDEDHATYERAIRELIEKLYARGRWKDSKTSR